jgi:predicted transcriptional regulator
MDKTLLDIDQEQKRLYTKLLSELEAAKGTMEDLSLNDSHSTAEEALQLYADIKEILPAIKAEVEARVRG